MAGDHSAEQLVFGMASPQPEFHSSICIGYRPAGRVNGRMHAHAPTEVPSTPKGDARGADIVGVGNVGNK